MTRLRDLHTELRRHQKRLGTPDESPCDFDAVLRLAHEINNQLTAEYMRASLAASAKAPSLASLCRQCLAT